MPTLPMDPRHERLIQWTGESIRLWNWPLVVTGQLSHSDIEKDVAERCAILRRMRYDELAILMLDSLPDEMFGHA